VDWWCARRLPGCLGVVAGRRQSAAHHRAPHTAAAVGRLRRNVSMCPRPRERRSGAQLSRLSLLLGFVSTATLITAFVSNVWIYTKEPVKLPNVDVATTVTFKIGFWRVCPQLKRAPNMTRREYKNAL
jgi:hypothetical protein